MKTYRSPSSLLFSFVIYLVMVLTLALCLIPFLYMLALSISSPKAIIQNEVFLIPKGLNLQSYIQIFSYPNFFKAYGNTVFYTVGGTAISLTLMILFAYPLSKTRLKGVKVVMRLVIFSMFFSGGLIPNYLLVSSLGLTNTPLAMLIPFAINQFNLILLINFFKSIPVDLEEAAIIDGLDYKGILVLIIVPLSTAALATVGLYTAVFFWNDWFHGLIYLKSSSFGHALSAQHRHRHQHGRRCSRFGRQEHDCNFHQECGDHHQHASHHHSLSLPPALFRQRRHDRGSERVGRCSTG